MKLIFFLALSALSYNLQACSKELPMYFYLQSSEKDPTLGDNSLFIIHFEGLPIQETPTHIYWSIDKGETQHTALNTREDLKIPTLPGNHSFQFFYTDSYTEIQTQQVRIKQGHKDTYVATFQESYERIEVEKPVIYFYPETRTDIEVQLTTKGALNFTYPQYDQGWKGTAHPNGKIEIDGQEYPYLFWESDLPQFETDWSEGNIVRKHEVIPFLEEQLSHFGLNPQEKTDFITYWGPQLAQHPQCAVKFLVQEECAQMADLIVLPKPDHINRIYILWAPIENLTDYSYLRPQKLHTVNRLGFDVLEWGGSKLPVFPVNSEEL